MNVNQNAFSESEFVYDRNFVVASHKSICLVTISFLFSDNFLPIIIVELTQIPAEAKTVLHPYDIKVILTSTPSPGFEPQTISSSFFCNLAL